MYIKNSNEIAKNKFLGPIILEQHERTDKTIDLYQRNQEVGSVSRPPLGS